MRIAINTLSENPIAPSGAFGFYQNLIREMEDIIGDDTLYLFVSKAGDKYFGPYGNPNIRKVIFRFSNERKWLRILTEHFIFPFIILKYRIHVLDTGTSILYCPSRLIATLKTMHVFTNPEAIPLATRIYRKLAYRLTRWNASGVISNSESQTRDMVKFTGIQPSKIHLVYEAIDHNIFKPALNNEQNRKYLNTFGIVKPYILFVSSLYPYKNAEVLIRTFARLKQGNRMQLVIVGFPRDESYQISLHTLVRQLKLEDLVVFTGGVDQRDTARFYQSAEVFVYPSRYETFGLTILEAMACGCPVITSNVSAMPEIGGNAALYFHPDDDIELAEKLESLLDSEDEKSRIRSLGFSRAATFTWKSTAEKTYKVLSSVIFNKGLGK